MNCSMAVDEEKVIATVGTSGLHCTDFDTKSKYMVYYGELSKKY